MKALLHLSSRIYDKLLFLYPEDLRRDFGDEIALAFADDIEAAWRQGRVMGIIYVWCCAIREVLTVALPGQASNPCVLVPAIAFALAAFTQGAELCVALHVVPRVERLQLMDAIRLAVLLPSFANAVVAFVVNRIYARRSITTLQLD
jgi:hypothetical protein